jgi:hypothetical protein
MRSAWASKPDDYLLGSYRIATAPASNSNRLTSFKSTCFDSQSGLAPVGAGGRHADSIIS